MNNGVTIIARELGKDEQFFALTESPKQLESFFNAYSGAKKLYYERRSRQYDSQQIEKTRVVPQANLARSFSAMFLGDPHTVARSYKIIRSKLGDDIFREDHKLLPYYVAAYALYKLEYLFRSHKVDPKYKSARYHLLYAVRLLTIPEALPPMNSRAMEECCSRIAEVLWDQAKSDDVFGLAVEAIDTAVGEQEFSRDAIRTQPFTQMVRNACRV